jgi:hypothetical protein
MKSSLVSDVNRLLESQVVEWPLLARGLQGLRESQTRVERVFGRDVMVRHIPHRIKSTTAPVDAISVSQRPCFLCPMHLDPEEQGIPFNVLDGCALPGLHSQPLMSEFMLYPNPFPILERHLTIVHANHRLQRIAGQFGVFLELAEALPDSFMIYNGPECGASAPDHLHFQACSRQVFPIERDNHQNFRPRVFILRDREKERLVSRLEALSEALRDVTEPAFEPMINVAGWFSGGEWSVFVFPRGKHRPRVFETGELTVSPATIDLCGVFVVPKPDDFAIIRGSDIEKIFEEITLPADQFEAVLGRLGGKP